MGVRLDEALKHRFIYVPRGTKKDTLQPGKMLGLAIARELRLPLTVLSVQRMERRTTRNSPSTGS